MDMHACTHHLYSHTYAEAHTCTCSHKMNASTYIHAHPCRHAYVLMHTLAHTPHMQILHMFTHKHAHAHSHHTYKSCTLQHAYTHTSTSMQPCMHTRAHTQTKPGQCRPSFSPSCKDNIMAKENSLPFANPGPRRSPSMSVPTVLSPQ